MSRINIRELQGRLSEIHARWEPATDAAVVEREYRLGYVPGPFDGSLETREFNALANLRYFMIIEATRTRDETPRRYPDTYDWRNVGGRNFITPVRDQGNCGSCVSFGCVAAVEAACLIRRS